MEKNEHLTYFKVKNFKRFEEFELKDITQFNIIVGDNNVGKTSLLEALLFTEDIDKQFFNILGSFFYKFSKGFSGKIKSHANTIKYIFPLFFNDKEKREHTFITKNSTEKKKEYTFKISLFDKLTKGNKDIIVRKSRQTNGNIIILTKNSKVIDIKSESDISSVEKICLNYIPFSLGYNDDLINFYSSFIQQNKDIKKNFVESLKSFIPDIESVEITTRFLNHPVIEIFEKSSNEPKLLSTYGDGVNKLFRILAEIIVSKGKRLMIDEIDTGIHYSRFEEFWKIIIKTAKKYDVQIYATTHNPDCLNYLVDAIENIDEDAEFFKNQTSVFALDELPDKSVKSYKHDYKGFSFLIKKGIEIRGGNNE